MPRDLAPEVLAQLNSRTVFQEYLFEGIFRVQTLRLWTGFGPIEWAGKTYLGNGWLYEPSAIREAVDGIASGLTVTIAAIPTSMISLALTECQQSGIGRLHSAFFNEAGTLLDVDTDFVGSLDKVILDEDESTSLLKLTYESRHMRTRSSRERRWNNESQKADYPEDRGFEYGPYLQQQRLYWGRHEPSRVRSSE